MRPLWKNLLLGLVLLVGIIYALPNIYGEDPALQIKSSEQGVILDQNFVDRVGEVLHKNGYKYSDASLDNDSLIVRFNDADAQLKASEAVKIALGDKYIVAMNLVSRTPKWLLAIGAKPMKLGLDLRGGVHLLLDVDLDTMLKARATSDLHGMGEALRNENIRYAGISPIHPNGIRLKFRDKDGLNSAYDVIKSHFSDYVLTKSGSGRNWQLDAILTQASVFKVASYAIDQTMSILRNRVNALGVSEAIVQQQGTKHISVDLPGIQDAARAKDIIGKTPILKFQMVDTEHDVVSAMAGDVPVGSRLYKFEGRPVLLKDQVILKGSSITFASAGYAQDGRTAVNVRLGGGGESLFSRATSENVGKPMAVLYSETKTETKIIDGKKVSIPHQEKKIISVATINQPLYMSFQITGLENEEYAQNLALLLRSGALVAPVNIIEELTVGPSMGKANINKGILSVVVGFIFVVLFMLFYYRLFGLIADLALFMNLVFIVAILSILGATLTVPGIAGIVLTVGIVVDANVLIYERIREELRNGVSPHAGINSGYAKALVTIVDANVTTLIVALILFALGSGAVKGFAITLTIGIMSSLFMSVVFSRAIVDAIYGRKSVQTLSIGLPKKKSNKK